MVKAAAPVAGAAVRNRSSRYRLCKTPIRFQAHRRRTLRLMYTRNSHCSLVALAVAVRVAATERAAVARVAATAAVHKAVERAMGVMAVVPMAVVAMVTVTVLTGKEEVMVVVAVERAEVSTAVVERCTGAGRRC